jgi:hypothetical protein
MSVNIKKDEETGEFYIDIQDLKELFEDISIIDSYVFEELDDGGFSLQFYDKNDNIVHPIKK